MSDGEGFQTELKLEHEPTVLPTDPMEHGQLDLGPREGQGLTLQLDGLTGGRAVVTPVEAARLVDSLYLLGGPHHHPGGDKERCS